MDNDSRRRHRLLALAIAVVAVAGVVVFLWLNRTRVERAYEHLSGNAASQMHVDVSRDEYPVKGIDISHYQGDIDFRRVAADSVEFVMIKATEGIDHVDTCMTRNYYGAKGAGLKTGFYHFFRFDRGGVRQGRHFDRVTRGLPVELPLVIDVETANNPAEDYYKVVGRLRDMISFLRRHGHRVMIYCNTVTYETYIRGNFEGTDLWIASEYEACATGDRRLLWQHSHNGRVDGIRTAVDINTFNGTRQAFNDWLASEGDLVIYGKSADADSLSADSIATHTDSIAAPMQ